MYGSQFIPLQTLNFAILSPLHLFIVPAFKREPLASQSVWPKTQALLCNGVKNCINSTVNPWKQVGRLEPLRQHV